MSGIHSQAFDSLRLKLTEVEGQLQREEEAHKRTEVFNILPFNSVQNAAIILYVNIH